MCKEVLLLGSPQKYGLSLAGRNIFSSEPVNVQKYHSTKTLETLLRFVEGKQIDLIHADHLHMAYYAIALKERLGVPAVLREHNLELKIMDRFAASSSNPLYRGYASFQAWKFRKYEPDTCARMDKCVMMTDQDRDRLLTLREGIDTTVIPAGVDTAFFKPAAATGDEDTVAYVGSLDWLPNIEGLKWFVHSVLPLIVKARPKVKFYIYGKNPSRDLFTLADGRNVFVEGFVNDVRDVYLKARVLVVPLRAGSGIRIKILEAMAAGQSIVTTSIGSEGIKCQDGKDIMIGDDEETFASKVIELLDDNELRAALGREAASLAAGEYSWDKIGEMFWKTYLALVGNQKENG